MAIWPLSAIPPVPAGLQLQMLTSMSMGGAHRMLSLLISLLPEHHIGLLITAGHPLITGRAFVLTRWETWLSPAGHSAAPVSLRLLAHSAPRPSKTALAVITTHSWQKLIHWGKAYGALISAVRYMTMPMPFFAIRHSR